MAKGKYSRKKSKKPVALIVAIVVLLLLLLVGLSIFVIPQWLYRMGDAAETEFSQIQETGSINENSSDETVLEQAISFPVSVADGKLEVMGLYVYTGINPDCGNREDSDIASITLKNTSDEYLSEATVSLKLSDGMVANFKVTDLPAGRSVMAFSTENTLLASDAVCAEVSGEGTFDSEASMLENAVSVNVDGMTITLTNISGSDMDEIIVYCHNILEPDYFGGTTYIYSIENLAAGASTTVDAVDCILGLAEVVRIDAEYDN